MQKYLHSLCLAIMLCCLSGFTQATEPPAMPDELTFGIVPLEAPAAMAERYSNLVNYLSETLGIPVKLVLPKEYNDLIEGMQAKRIDFGYFGPKSYVEAAKKSAAQAFALEVLQDGTKGYYGFIISKAGSGLNTLSDLKGKKWAFTDPDSTSGTLVPLVYLQVEARISPATYFSEVIYSGSHENSILAVKNGDVDAAATNDLDFERGVGTQQWQHDDFTFIWKSQLIPGAPIAYRQDLPDALKAQLKQAFLNYKDPAGLEKMKLSGYAAASDEDYSFVRKLLAFKNKLDSKKQNK